MLAGDASVDSWFREIHVPRAWRVYVATGFDFREKNRAFLGSIGARVCCQSPTLPYPGPRGFLLILSFFHLEIYVLYNLPVVCHVSHTVSLGYL